jgi:hypothetical protein
LLNSPPSGDEQDGPTKKYHKLAQGVTAKFYDAFDQRDLEGLLALVDVPWYHDGKAVLHDKAEIHAEFKSLLEKRRDVKIRKIPDIKAVLPYSAVRERTDPNERKWLDQVIQDQDLLVLVMLKPEAGKIGTIENVVALVKIRGGIAKVVGLKN